MEKSTSQPTESSEDAQTTNESLDTSVLSDGSVEENLCDFTEEEAKKAEEFKTQGNDLFKCKTRKS